MAVESDLELLKNNEIDKIEEIEPANSEDLTDYLEKKYGAKAEKRDIVRHEIEWYFHFKNLYDDVISLIDNECDPNETCLNPYYVPQMMERAVELYFTYLPLWCRIGHGTEKGSKDQSFTNGLVESFFNHVKNRLGSKEKKRATKFMKDMYEHSQHQITKIKNPRFFAKRPRSQKKIGSIKKHKKDSKQIPSEDYEDLKVEEEWNKPGRIRKKWVMDKGQ